MSTASRKPVIVVGAGIGGLSAAALLAARGERVIVVERAARPGGKLREVEVGDATIDAGPSVMTMKWVFDEIFAEAGGALADHVTLDRARVLARHAWDADQRLDLFADPAESEDAIGAFAGAAEVRGYRRFCAEARHIYETLEAPFLKATRPNPVSLSWRIGLRRLPDLLAINPYQSMWSALGRYFRDPRLRQLFGRYATYCGSSPFRAPGTLMLIAHVEQCGVWLVRGGMQRLAEGLERLGKAAGASFRYGEPCVGMTVDRGRVAGVTLASGETIEARAVIFNGDPSAMDAMVERAVRPVPPLARSLSAMTWLINAETDGFPLVRHNVFFSSDYEAEFRDIERGKLPEQPTAYVCAQDRNDHGARGPPTGPERLQLVVNAPPIGDVRSFDPAEIDTCETRMLGLLKACGLRIAAGPRLLTTPSDFAALFPGSGGALYGRASHGWAASFLRPGARTRMPGLYLAGGATHPGAGMPMAALSGRLAAQTVIADRAST